MAKKKANPHETFIVEIMRTADIIQYRIATLLREYELTPPQYNILRILRGAEGNLSVGEVKNRMHFETSDVSRLLDRLVRKGLTKRDICPDNRRKMDVCISKIGLKVLEKLDVEMAQRLNGFYADLISDKEVERTMELLERINASEPEPIKTNS